MGYDIKMSRIAKTLIIIIIKYDNNYHDNYTAMAAEQFDLGSIYVPLLDYIKSNITIRLLTDTLKASQLRLLMPNIIIKYMYISTLSLQHEMISLL